MVLQTVANTWRQSVTTTEKLAGRKFSGFSGVTHLFPHSITKCQPEQVRPVFVYSALLGAACSFSKFAARYARNWSRLFSAWACTFLS